MAEAVQQQARRRGASAPAARAGAAVSESTNSRRNGAEAAAAALARAGVDQCDLALAFFTSKHDATAFLEGVRSVIPAPTPVIGGSTVGIITNDYLGYEGMQGGVAVISSERMKADMFVERGLDSGEHAVGVRLGEQLRRASFDGEPNLLIMYDSVRRKSDQGMALNMALPLLRGMTEALDHWPPTAGVGFFGDMVANPTFQIFNDEAMQQAAMVLALHGGVRMDTIIMHGCKPSGAYHAITRAEQNVIHEIDGRPALDAVAELMGTDKSWEEYPLFLTFGVNKGEKFGEFREEDYANRLCMAVDPNARTIIMFEPDLQAGTEVQLMRRSIDFEYIGERTRMLLDSIDGRRPFFALYIDCAGRAGTYSGTEHEEGAEVQRALGDIPLLGMYSGVEIARHGDGVQPLDWTGVLCVFSEPQGES